MQITRCIRYIRLIGAILSINIYIYIYLQLLQVKHVGIQDIKRSYEIVPNFFPFQVAGRSLLNGLYPKAKAKGKAKAKAKVLALPAPPEVNDAESVATTAWADLLTRAWRKGILHCFHHSRNGQSDGSWCQNQQTSIWKNCFAHRNRPAESFWNCLIRELDHSSF